MTDLLRQTPVEVACDGPLVVLTLGNIGHSLEFQTAFQLSASMRLAARDAKLTAGYDVQRRRAVGVLHDADAPRKSSRFTSHHPAVLRSRDVGAWQEGESVALKLGSTTAKLPFPAALAIAQWLRVRGKEARNYVGETAHWSEFGNLHETG